MNATIEVICYKWKKLKNEKHPLMLRVTKDRKRKYVSLGVSDEAFVSVGTVLLTLGRSGLFAMLPDNFNVDEHVAKYPPYSNGFTSKLRFDNNKIYHLLGLLSSIPVRNKYLIVED